MEDNRAVDADLHTHVAVANGWARGSLIDEAATRGSDRSGTSSTSTRLSTHAGRRGGR